MLGIGTLARITVALTAGVAIAACSSGYGSSNSSPAASSPATSSPTATPAALVTLGQAKVAGSLKAVLKNSQGRTLYYFTPDTSTKVACTGGCAVNWPPLLAESDLPASFPGLPGKVGVLNGDNGKQVTYNGHPLYSYKPDAGSEDAFGQGLGAKWFVATPDLASA